MKRLPLIASFILFIALCVSAAYWAMQLFKPPVRPVAAPPQAVQPAPKLEAAANLLGGHANAVVASNFQLKGVVVANNPAESVAILVANGKPARAIRTDKEVVPGVTVKEINRQFVLLSEGGVIKKVELSVDTKAHMQVGLPANTAGPAPVYQPSLTPEPVAALVGQSRRMAGGAIRANPANTFRPFGNNGAPSQPPPNPPAMQR